MIVSGNRLEHRNSNLHMMMTLMQARYVNNFSLSILRRNEGGTKLIDLKTSNSTFPTGGSNVGSCQVF